MDISCNDNKKNYNKNGGYSFKVLNSMLGKIFFRLPFLPNLFHNFFFSPPFMPC